jgi:hypothetical protein
MIWARRIIDPAEWNEVQDQFENLFMKLGCPSQMMLVATCGPGPITLLASLPNPYLLNALTGSEQISDGEGSIRKCGAAYAVARWNEFRVRTNSDRRPCLLPCPCLPGDRLPTKPHAPQSRQAVLGPHGLHIQPF